MLRNSCHSRIDLSILPFPRLRNQRRLLDTPRPVYAQSCRSYQKDRNGGAVWLYRRRKTRHLWSSVGILPQDLYFPGSLITCYNHTQPAKTCLFPVVFRAQHICSVLLAHNS
ncbi:Hypothetical predicted protein [Podarcis lilfordi]|uniref:Uncharacterized protein n=1 Tax=Podarcis lilfordi TaxID=74358 RepID=A0AA35KMM5_9SAUR|nr:Hypothetical predicted protein [Podarcis lilfordi]